MYCMFDVLYGMYISWLHYLYGWIYTQCIVCMYAILYDTMCDM